METTVNISTLIYRMLAHDKHILPANIIEKLSDPETMKRAIIADDSVEVVAGLVIAALKGLSLDPHMKRFSSFEHVWYKENENSITFWISFHTVSNPFDAILTLPKSSPVTQLLMKAIEENLNSEMYAAAQEYRRIQPINVKESYELRCVAERAYNKAIADRKGKEAADEAFDKAFDTVKSQQLDDQMRNLANAACPALAGKYYTLWVAELLYANL